MTATTVLSLIGPGVALRGAHSRGRARHPTARRSPMPGVDLVPSRAAPNRSIRCRLAVILEAGEQARAQCLQRVVDDGVEGPPAALLPGDEAGVDEEFHVV